MRFERIVGPPKSPPRPPEPGPGFTRRADPQPADKVAARPDEKQVRPASYLILSLLFSGLLFAFFLVNDRGFLQVSRQRRQLLELHADVTALDKENRRLEQEIAALKNDPQAVEKIAREELNLVRPGDVVVVLPPGWKSRVMASATKASPAAAGSTSAAALVSPTPVP